MPKLHPCLPVLIRVLPITIILEVEPVAEHIQVNLTVNGRPVTAEVGADTSLMTFLRRVLHLTGVKNGCDSGHCGACTVIVDGKARRACLVKMNKVNGSQIETIEGLAADGQLHPLQYAFIREGAVQCGYCTPGMIMAAKALLDDRPTPTAEEIKKFLSQNNNLCRCTGYVQIITAIQKAAAMLQRNEPPPPLEAESLQTGTTRLSHEAVGLVTGTTLFSDDLEMEGMLYGKILWAEHPHAEILDIDTAAAEALPGVVRVITAADIPGKNQAGIVIRDQPALAADKVRYIGDPVAVVFAESEAVAEQARDLIAVHYRPLPGVFTPQDAARPDAPKIHDKGNLAHHASIIRGDVEAAFADCAVIVEGDYHTPFIEHAFIEPESGVAYPDGSGGIVLQMGTQSAFDVRAQLAEILALPEEKIRVIQMPMGGAFGGKEDPIIEQHLALGALLTGRPVKITLTREESLRVHAKRHPAWMHYKTGADGQGRLLAIEAQIVLDAGAYMSLSYDVLENTLVFGAGPYFVPNLKLEGWAWHTNNVIAGAMRGFGVNQVAVALEQQIDEIARRLGLDPFDIRLLNGLDVGLPTAADHVLDKGVVSIKETIRAAREKFAELSLPQGDERKKIGVGVAAAAKNIGFGHGLTEKAAAILSLSSDGRVTVRHSQHEYGQGAQAGLARLVSMELGVPVDDITLIGPDTAQTPPTGPTTASRQTFLTGNAVLMACRALKEEVCAHAAELLDRDPAVLQLQGDRVVDPRSGKAVALSQLGDVFTVERVYAPGESAPLLEGEPSHYGQPDFVSRPTHWCYAYNTQVAVVEVDTRSYEVRVLRIISANDLGKVLNEPAVLGQIYGGVVMGLGFALSEEFVVENGYNKTDTLRKCRIPTIEQTPEIIPVLVEVPHPEGPRGAKGFAEAPSLATAPAILNAIYDAVGVRIYQTPADKKRLRAALRATPAAATT
ncbi:MAG: aldehyde oxidoreductase [Caldilineae bacterium]|nr:MAG: aldehyde oxidoreductase [Caldilineae bacterium]